jgi:hypothetical protein
MSELRRALAIDRPQHREIHFGTLPAPCTAAGQPAVTSPRFVPTTMSDEFGQLSIVATPRALIAYRTR